MILRKRRQGDKIDKLYDSFKIKDMPRSEFRRRYLAAANPALMRRDLSHMRTAIQTERMSRDEIDRRLGGT